jgi:hypothetical protein
MEAVIMSIYRKIASEDVRKGDTIRATFMANGLVATREGVAHGKSPSGVITTVEGGYIGCETSNLYLVDRPKPVLPTEPGSVIIATKVRDLTGEWAMALVGKNWYSAGRVCGLYAHTPERIQEWIPAKIVPAEATP